VWASLRGGVALLSISLLSLSLVIILLIAVFQPRSCLKTTTIGIPFSEG
jgi:hypothetical protein